MKKGYWILAAAVIAGSVMATALFSMKNSKAEGIVYSDTAVEYGTLTAGLTKTAKVSVTVVEQMFGFDVSALTGDEPGSWELQVGEVLVSAGQAVQKGTALFQFTPDSVNNVRTSLQKEIIDTNRDYELLQVKQKELRLQVSQGYDNYVTGGNYAGVIYDNACDALQEKMSDAKEAVDNKQNQVNENLLELTQTQQELEQAQRYLREAEAAVSENYSDRYNEAYYYTVYENTRETAELMVQQLTEKIEGLTKKNELLLYEVDEAVRTYHQVLLDLEKEKLALKMECDTEMYYSGMAEEWYDIQIARLDNALQDARERCKSALQAIRMFDAYVVRNRVLSSYNGIVSDIMVEEGDYISWNDRLIAMYDMEAVTMDIALSGEDYAAVDQERNVNIAFADYPDEIYEGRITGVSGAKYDSCPDEPYYTVTVTVLGDVAGLDKMSGDVTFMTHETKEALYVPNRAIFKEGDRYYVKLRKKNGDIVEKNVATGISDGVHTEIVKGISKGDVVVCPL